MLPSMALSTLSEGSTRRCARGKAPEILPASDTPVTHESRTSGHSERHRFLSAAEWSLIANRLGGIKEGEEQAPCHPSHWLWPPVGMPRGLYRDVVSHKYRFYYLFHLTSIFRLTLLASQLLLGAALTALGAMSSEDGKAITILGATNTVVAGFLAFMHNSGLPDRYWSDMVEFEDIEDHIKEILDSGIAIAEQPVEQILAECFDRYHHAKSTVAVNMPANYAASRQMLPLGTRRTVSDPRVSGPSNASAARTN